MNTTDELHYESTNKLLRVLPRAENAMGAVYCC
jgi:hypothetical protein